MLAGGCCAAIVQLSTGKGGGKTAADGEEEGSQMPRKRRPQMPRMMRLSRAISSGVLRRMRHHDCWRQRWQAIRERMARRGGGSCLENDRGRLHDCHLLFSGHRQLSSAIMIVTFCLVVTASCH